MVTLFKIAQTTTTQSKMVVYSFSGYYIRMRMNKQLLRVRKWIQVINIMVNTEAILTGPFCMSLFT